MIHFNSSKILIPVDFSETSLLAIKHGAFLAQLTKGDVHLIHVINRHYESYVVISQPVLLENASRISETVMAKLNELANDIRSDYSVNVNCIVADNCYGYPWLLAIGRVGDWKQCFESDHEGILSGYDDE
jgi:nucleotide-binding universal stress UspA family protein